MVAWDYLQKKHFFFIDWTYSSFMDPTILTNRIYWKLYSIYGEGFIAFLFVIKITHRRFMYSWRILSTSKTSFYYMKKIKIGFTIGRTFASIISYRYPLFSHIQCYATICESLIGLLTSPFTVLENHFNALSSEFITVDWTN